MANESEETATRSREVLQPNLTLGVWLLFLGLGGGILALYYARIGYLPDIEWNASIVYLAAASIIGGGVGLLLALSLFLPGYIWAEVLICEPHLAGVFCFDEIGLEPCLRSVLFRLGLPFGAALFVSHIALKAGVLGYTLIALAVLAVTFFTMRERFRKLLNSEKEPTPNTETSTSNIETSRRAFKYAGWFTLSVLLNQISMFLMYRLSGQPSGTNFVILTATCTTGVLISNLVVATRHHRFPRQALVASIVAAALLLFTADRFSPLSLRVMGFFGFGDNNECNLVLTEAGADIIQKLALPEKCPAAAPNRVCGVEILSKVGTEYFLSMCTDPGPAGQKCRLRRTFTLPKTDVISRDSLDRRK
ncbi:MAG TPA: hypothetical protein VK557_14775 [Pyrinomonadaceae bacterium]|nr:hypothetical protein [Pyrinomonadaceae bacterium]